MLSMRAVPLTSINLEERQDWHQKREREVGNE